MHGYCCTHACACEVMNLGLLYMEFCDAVKEGDGDRVRVIRVFVYFVYSCYSCIRVWKYLMLLYRVSMLLYRASRRTNSLEYHVSLAPQCRNISCDLHMEQKRLIESVVP